MLNWLKYYVTTALLIGLFSIVASYFLFSCYNEPPKYDDDGFSKAAYLAFCIVLPALAAFYVPLGTLIIATILDLILRFGFKDTRPYRKVLAIIGALLVIAITGLIILFIIDQ